MSEKQKKVLIYSLLAYTIGGFLFAVGVMFEAVIALITFFTIGMTLLVSGILCLYNNYKLEKHTTLYLYLVVIGVLLSIFFTTVLFIQLTAL